jgi:hypothetical protein
MNGRLNAAHFSDPAIAFNGPTQVENQDRETKLPLQFLEKSALSGDHASRVSGH